MAVAAELERDRSGILLDLDEHQDSIGVGLGLALQASTWGSLLPAVWSFMLAARSRGLGTSWTTLHLLYEADAAAILDIPVTTVTQGALIPVAHTRGTTFKPARREPLDSVLHLETW
jgi:nitroreductase